MQRYAYLLGVLLLSPLFFVIFFRRKDLRVEMLVIGVLGGLVAITTAQYFLGKYWSPITLFNFKNSIEDFIFGFLLCSESAGIYSFIFSKHYGDIHLRNAIKANVFKILITILVTPTLFIILEQFTELNPIYNSIISIIIPLGIITLKKSYLIKVLIFTGLFILLYTITLYLIFNILFSGIVADWWNLNNISGILLFGTPIEELIWFTLTGMFCSVSYKFVFDIKFIETKKV